MNRVLNLTLCASLALGGLGCSKLIDQLNQKKKAEAMLASASALASAMAVPTVITPATVGTTTVVPPTSPSVSDAQIPTPEDFEQAAAREITDSNAQAELDKLKKDIGP